MTDIVFDYVLVTDHAEQLAVLCGDVEGDVYRDGEIYADRASLDDWRSNKNHEEADDGQDSESD